MFLEKFPYNTTIQSDRFPESIPSFIEVSQSSRMKYEWSQTLCDDGDPLDVLVICDGPLIPGCFVQVRPICYMVMEDEKGNDEKLLAVVEKDPHYSHIKTIDDIPDHTLKEISQFFETYKTLEKEKWVKIGGWKNKDEAFKLIKSTHEKYKREKNLSSDSLISLSDNK